jgi:hypothetical protein
MKQLEFHCFGGYPAFALFLALGSPQSLRAQEHEHAEMKKQDISPRKLVTASDGSGTSWLPANTPMNAIHGKWNDWDLMLHSQIFLQYIETSGKRGDRQFGSINWFMGMMERPLGEGKIGLRSMLSLEPWTVGKCGFPDLLQTGEECNGEKIHDRQHPHDLFMELAAIYELPLSDDLGIRVYGGPAGEPALGPTAFPHRASAFPGPLAPISHHWLDASHISFGVTTLGLHGKTWMIETSAFNGREPDDERSNFDIDGLDSYSGRVTLMPSGNAVFQVSGAYIGNAEESENPNEKYIDVKRFTTSLSINQELTGGLLSSTLAYGINQEHSIDSSSILVETSLSTNFHYTLGFRGEWVQKTGHDLVIDETGFEERRFDLGKVSLSLLREFPGDHAWLPGIGASVDISTYPKDLEAIYGNRWPLGYVLFASLRPKAMDMSHHHNM